MRERVRWMLTGFVVALICLGVSGGVFALTQKQATLSYNDIKISYDGKALSPKDASGADVEPFIIDGTTYLPVRAVGEAFGLLVGWEQSTATVTLTTPDGKTATYITRTGAKYHRDSSCNGGTYWAVPFETAIGMGLEPCDKCIN